MAEELSKLLSKQNEQNLLPKTILYCLNPRDNEVLGTMIGNFQGEGCRARCSSVPAGGLTIRKTAWSVR
jgi:glucuronate isomerase